MYIIDIYTINYLFIMSFNNHCIHRMSFAVSEHVIDFTFISDRATVSSYQKFQYQE